MHADGVMKATVELGCLEGDDVLCCVLGVMACYGGVMACDGVIDAVIDAVIDDCVWMVEKERIKIVFLSLCVCLFVVIVL
jgi:hypothetical protein